MLQGLLTALATPFDNDGQLDIEGLKYNIRYQIMSGINGLVPLGTTGESPTLTTKEKFTVIETTLAEVAGRVPVIVGTGTNATATTIEATQLAKHLGAQAALIVSPYYNKPSQEGLIRHFFEIADRADFPIVVYNNQGRTAQNIPTGTLKRLAEHPRIIGVKDSSGSLPQMMDVYQTICQERTDFALISGDDPLNFPCLAIGGHGAISVASNLIPEAMVAMFRAFQAGELEAARRQHYEMLPLINTLFIETNPVPLKAAMKYREFPSGSCRLPLCDLLPENQQKLIQAIDSFVRHPLPFA